MSDFDAIVVGAGAVGLACAARLARSGRAVLVLDRNARVGQETSSRNSGVIHAGIYYPEGSLKARLCTAGRELLYARCARRGLSHRKLGKLIVACAQDELAALDGIRARAARNGVTLDLLDPHQVAEKEPLLQVAGALWSPETGIVDAHELMADYHRELVEHDGLLCLHTQLTSLAPSGSGWRVTTLDTRDTPTEVTAPVVVNAAGLHADRVAAMAGLDVEGLGLRLRWCKGDYFALASRWSGRIRHLVYPLPVHAGLGVHLTLDLGGQVIAGPDTEYVSEIRYDVLPDKRLEFARAVRRYLPEVADDELHAAYAGVRPKLQGPGEGFRDFVIEEARPHGLPGLVNLIGIESPGLTASEAIAERVLVLVEGGQVPDEARP